MPRENNMNVGALWKRAFFFPIPFKGAENLLPIIECQYIPFKWEAVQYV